jgi:tetratricopeptide (TPR) repeat protein
MPLSGAKDIPHVRIHDHYIRKRPAQMENSASKKFKGLSCINDSKPDSLSIARAYLQQYEKFESNNSTLLDSASSYLKYSSNASMKVKFHEIILLHYLQADYPSILKLVNAIGSRFIVSDIIGTQSWSNREAWTAYRIGEAYTNAQQIDKAMLCYQAAYYLAPHYFEFANKYGASAMQNNKKDQAKLVYEKLVKESPFFAPAWSNLGYIFLLDGDVTRAENLYRKSLALDPDYQPALLNLVGLHLYRNEIMDAKNLLQKIVKKHPSNSQAQEILKTLK